MPSQFPLKGGLSDSRVGTIEALDCLLNNAGNLTPSERLAFEESFKRLDPEIQMNLAEVARALAAKPGYEVYMAICPHRYSGIVPPPEYLLVSNGGTPPNLSDLLNRQGRFDFAPTVSGGSTEEWAYRGVVRIGSSRIEVRSAKAVEPAIDDGITMVIPIYRIREYAQLNLFS